MGIPASLPVFVEVRPPRAAPVRSGVSRARRILIADADAATRGALRAALEAGGCEVVLAASGDAASQLLAAEPFDFAFLDLCLPQRSGLELLDEIARRGPGAPLVAIATAESGFHQAIDAMKRGAFDYLVKPVDPIRAQALVEQALRRRRASRRELRPRLAPPLQSAGAAAALIGSSRAMLETFKTLGRVAQSDVAVLIRGESGTGKELVARAIHAHSKRCAGPFVAINMSAIPSELLESELFGHERGAFTGAVESRSGCFREAEGGTLLLDEIGDLGLSLQSKLLRVLQEREVTPVGGKRPLRIDVRILAATHQDLEQAVAERRFREDLYFRLNVVPIRIPPLRERRDDIPPLVQHFCERFAAELGVPRRWASAAALERLQARRWPGNVRELENVVKRALVLAPGDVITPEDLALAADRDPRPAHWSDLAREELVALLAAPGGAPGAAPFWDLVERLERVLIGEAMRRTGGNYLHASRVLGINRNTLRKKLADLGLTTT